MNAKVSKPSKRRGPEPELVKIRGSWQKAVAEALKKPPVPKPPKDEKK